MERVCVLMSTYNGEKYLRDQIESIVNQKDVEVKLLVRDDGSIDNTCVILQEYKEQGLLDWYTGKNIGPAKSFWDLLNNSPVSDYYAFADQDDYWLEDKLNRAISIIQSRTEDGAKLYFSKKTIVDENLKDAGVQDEIVRGVGLQYSLLRGFAAGCTMVFNKSLFEELVKYTPEVMTMHDSWILKVAGAIGMVIYDDESRILYRQHSNNTVGNQTFRKKIIRHLRNLNSYRYDNSRCTMAKQLFEIYQSQMKYRDKYYTELIANSRRSLTSRVRMIFSNYYKTQVRGEILAFKLLLILGWI